MVNPNTVYGTIVVGTGITGGWVAKELCENGLKTLVLERDRMAKHLQGRSSIHNTPKGNKYNPMNNFPSVHRINGTSMISANQVIPSLTYMAFMARAANHAAEWFRACLGICDWNCYKAIFSAERGTT